MGSPNKLVARSLSPPMPISAFSEGSGTLRDFLFVQSAECRKAGNELHTSSLGYRCLRMLTRNRLQARMVVRNFADAAAATAYIQSTTATWLAQFVFLARGFPVALPLEKYRETPVPF